MIRGAQFDSVDTIQIVHICWLTIVTRLDKEKRIWTRKERAVAKDLKVRKKAKENWKQKCKRKDRCVSGDRFSGERAKAYVQKRLWSIKEMEFLCCDLRLLTLTFCERYHILLQRTCIHVNNTLHILLSSPAWQGMSLYIFPINIMTQSDLAYRKYFPQPSLILDYYEAASHLRTEESNSRDYEK